MPREQKTTSFLQTSGKHNQPHALKHSLRIQGFLVSLKASCLSVIKHNSTLFEAVRVEIEQTALRGGTQHKHTPSQQAGVVVSSSTGPYLTELN